MNFKKILLYCWIIFSYINVNATENSTYNQRDNAQEDGVRISGTVVDTEKFPLIGVTIIVKDNPSIGTVTNLDGHFYLDVPSKESTIIVSYIAFETQEIKVGSKINFDIILEEVISSLDEVVVTGYGHQKRMSVIGSIETINPK